jgi:Domain of unknown function (DUF4055)
MPIHSKHIQYDDGIKKKWKHIRDCLDEAEIKKEARVYLPQPPGRDDDDYQVFLERAFFYGVCGWTLLGMIGAIFRKPGKIELPDSIKYLADDVDGMGCGAFEQAKDTCNNSLPIGRHGLFLDFPQSKEKMSVYQESESNLRFRIASFSAEDIINWKEGEFGGIRKLTMVVLKEAYYKDEDDFKQSKAVRYRCLRLTGDGYEMQVWTPKVEEPVRDEDYEIEVHNPTFQKERIQFIPFTFIGSENNKPDIDPPPFYSLAKANVSHYQDSADWQDAVFMVGQPTLYMSGMTQEFIDILRADKLYPFKMGSRTLLPLPEGGDVGLVESKADKSLIERSMDRKERLMAMLGARLVEEKKQTEATETHRMREGAKTSVLRNVVDGVEKAYQKIFNWAAEFSGSDAGKVDFQLNHDFFEQSMSADEALKWTQVWQMRGLAKSDFHSLMQKGEVISPGRSREDVDSDLAEETADIPRVNDGGE